MPSGFAIEETQKRKLWGAVLAVKQLYTFNEKWNSEFIPSFEELFRKYEDDVSLSHLAFPGNWLAQLRKS